MSDSVDEGKEIPRVLSPRSRDSMDDLLSWFEGIENHLNEAQMPCLMCSLQNEKLKKIEVVF